MGGDVGELLELAIRPLELQGALGERGGLERELLLRPPAVLPPARRAKLAFDRRRQAREVRLHHVVVGACPHRLDRGLLADLAGDDDEREVELPLLDRLQRAEAAVAGKHVVGEDDVPDAQVEGALERVACLHPFVVELVPAELQVPLEETCVVLVVLEKERAKRRESGRGHTAGGGSFRSSQYMPIWRTASVNWSKSTGLRM